jgi:hypothetical protein
VFFILLFCLRVTRFQERNKNQQCMRVRVTIEYKGQTMQAVSDPFVVVANLTKAKCKQKREQQQQQQQQQQQHVAKSGKRQRV